MFQLDQMPPGVILSLVCRQNISGIVGGLVMSTCYYSFFSFFFLNGLLKEI